MLGLEDGGEETNGLERRDLGAAAERLHVVDSETALLLQEFLPIERVEVGHLRDQSVGPVLRRLEVHGGGPVVAEIFRVRARGASRCLGRIMVGRVHGEVERVTADDLVRMRGGVHAGADDRVGPFNHELGATEAETVSLCRCMADCQRGDGEGPYSHGGERWRRT